MASFAAAGADAAPAPLRFAVSITGTAHDVWDFTGGPTQEGTCERRVRSEGIRDVRFRTTKPTVVRVTDGRLLTTTIRNSAGTVTLGGANTTTLTCGSERTQAIADCARTRRSFRKATVRAARGTRPGSITLGPARATLRRSFPSSRPMSSGNRSGRFRARCGSRRRRSRIRASRASR